MRAKLVFEKFIEDSDPVQDMGIGLPFLRLIPGMILQAKKEVRITNRTKFSSQGTRRIWKGHYVTILKAERTPLKNKIKVWYHETLTLPGAYNVRETINRHSLANSMTGSAKQFENRFIIIK